MELIETALFLVGAISGLMSVVFGGLASLNYFDAQNHRIGGKEKDRIGYFDDMSLMFDDQNYTDQGLRHRQKYYSYSLSASISILVLITTIVVGMIFGMEFSESFLNWIVRLI